MSLRTIGIPDILRRNGRLFAERPAFFFADERVSHGAFLQRVERLAAGLAAAGIGAGDRVAILSRNNLDFITLWGAAAWLNAILLPVNWRLNAEEVAYILSDGAPKMIVADAEDQPRVAALRESLPASTSYFGIGGAIEPFRPFAALGASAGAPPAVEIDPEAGSVIIHTAAVDGKPRGALLSQANLVTAAQQQTSYWHLDEQDIGLNGLPLFHIAGLGFLFALNYCGGASVILPRYDAEMAARQVAAARVTVFSEFAPMLAQLLDKAAEIGADLGSLRAVTGLDSPETIARFEAACPKARFWAGYGQTETSGFVTFGSFRDRPGAAGRPTPSAVVGLVTDQDEPIAAGVNGEIVVRGPLVFRGYWGRETDTAFTLREGWHHTGDLGRFDADGYLWYAGRSPAKELIKPGGENVYPAEVEKVIREHDAIAEVVVLGVPDVQWGEAVKAVCACRPGRSVAAQELVDFVGGRIARYKKPKHVVFVDALPKTAQGAIDRMAVKQQHGAA
ncbi:MAG TPA: AMP-binding protein [Stellaceae bacterium]|nr:AMP-binding protein [Stellaceae bacterium]